MLVVRDKQGHVFGGYASESWTKNGKFFGEVIIFHILLSVWCHRCTTKLRSLQHKHCAFRGVGEADSTCSCYTQVKPSICAAMLAINMYAAHTNPYACSNLSQHQY